MSAAFFEKLLADLGATGSVACLFIGEKLGLFKALAVGPANSVELARRSGLTERYVREWLINQAASGYVAYDSASGTYSIPAENVPVLVDESSPMYFGGGAQAAIAMVKAEERITELFKTGEGMSWGDHHSDLFEGVGRFFRAGYQMNLVQKWIPLFEGLTEKLEAGAVVADVGCGHGVSTVVLAKAFPRSKFYGFDSHGPSLERARAHAAAEGALANVEFELATALDYPASGYDLIAMFNTLHDVGQSVEAAKHARAALKDDGELLLVEPNAADTIQDNLNLVGQIFSASSVLCCTPHAYVSAGDRALGTIPTDEKLREVLSAGGFSRFRRVTQTRFNRVLQARP